MQRPQPVTAAIHAIWLTIVVDAAIVLAGLEGSPADIDAIAFNGIVLMVYALVARKIGAGCNWARLTYAVLVAGEFAMVAAFEQADATELEQWVTYLMLPLEIWILCKLYGAEADAWFKRAKDAAR